MVVMVTLMALRNYVNNVNLANHQHLNQLEIMFPHLACHKRSQEFQVSFPESHFQLTHPSTLGTVCYPEIALVLGPLMPTEATIHTEDQAILMELEGGVILTVQGIHMEVVTIHMEVVKTAMVILEMIPTAGVWSMVMEMEMELETEAVILMVLVMAQGMAMVMVVAMATAMEIMDLGMMILYLSLIFQSVLIVMHVRNEMNSLKVLKMIWPMNKEITNNNQQMEDLVRVLRFSLSPNNLNTLIPNMVVM